MKVLGKGTTKKNVHRCWGKKKAENKNVLI